MNCFRQLFATSKAGILFLAPALIIGLAQSPYTPPPASSAVLSRINFKSSQPIQTLQGRYSACDQTDVCDGRKLEKPYQCSSDPSHNTVFLKFETGVIFFDGKMAIDADGSQLSKARGGTDLPETAWHYPTPPRDSVDSEHVPYIVLPSEFVARKYSALRQGVGVQIGDIAAVVYNGRVRYALVADSGPACKIGEGSMKLHDELGNPACVAYDTNGICNRASNRGIPKDVLYFIFPHSAGLIAKGLTPENINERLENQGAKLMQTLEEASTSTKPTN